MQWCASHSKLAPGTQVDAIVPGALVLTREGDVVWRMCALEGERILAHVSRRERAALQVVATEPPAATTVACLTSSSVSSSCGSLHLAVGGPRCAVVPDRTCVWHVLNACVTSLQLSVWYTCEPHNHQAFYSEVVDTHRVCFVLPELFMIHVLQTMGIDLALKMIENPDVLFDGNSPDDWFTWM